MKTKPGVARYATSRVNDEVSAYKLGLHETILESLINHTNEKGDAFMGLLVLTAVFKSHKKSLNTLCHESFGRPIFRATMSAQKRSTEKGSSVTEMWQMWNERQGLLMNPGQGITVDEQLVAFRGRVFCRQYMPNKPAIYGLKFFNACCSDTAFVLKSKFYKGKSVDGERATNQGQRVTEELVLGAEYDGRCMIVDNFFASYTLGESLLKNNIIMAHYVKTENASHQPFYRPRIIQCYRLYLLSSRIPHWYHTSLRKGKT